MFNIRNGLRPGVGTVIGLCSLPANAQSAGSQLKGVMDSMRARTLERVDSPAQIDSWNRTWAFFDWILRPYEDRSKPLPACATQDCSRRRAIP